MTQRGTFQWVAEIVAVRLAELVGARVAVLDGRGVLVASSPMEFRGGNGDGAPALEVLLDVDGAPGRVLVDPAAHTPLTPLVAQTLVDLLAAETRQAGSRDTAQELRNRFLQELLYGPPREEAALRREGQVLGLLFARPRAVILLDVAGYVMEPVQRDPLESGEGRVQRRVQLVLSSVGGFFRQAPDTVTAYLGEGQFVILKPAEPAEVAGWERNGTAVGDWARLASVKEVGVALINRLRQDTRMPLAVGIGRYAAGFAGAAESYREGLSAIILGTAVFGFNRVYSLDDLGPIAFVGGAPAAAQRALARQVLARLESEPDLITTMETYFAQDASATQTAARLMIHRNTLTYRLDRVTALTGRNPRHFEDAVVLRSALLLRMLDRHEASGLQPGRSRRRADRAQPPQ